MVKGGVDVREDIQELHGDRAIAGYAPTKNPYWRLK